MTGPTLEQLRKKHKGRRHTVAFPDLREANAPVLGNGFAKGGFRRDPLAYRWQRGREESAETVREIEAKRTRVASLFHKGATQYISPGTDPRTIGRK